MSAARISPDAGDPSGRRFNYDIRMNEEDQEAARVLWPALAERLIDRQLIEAILPHEQAAARCKKKVQRIGSIAVLLMLGAISFSLWHLLEERPAATVWSFWGRRVVEVSGIAGLALAFLASRFGPLRRSWLRSRTYIEALRQWHFRGLLDIDGLSVAGREKELRSLKEALKDIGSRMDQLAKGGRDPLDGVRPIPRPKLPKSPDERGELLNAYKRLRLDHQRDYAVHKLSPEDRTFSGLSSAALVGFTELLAGSTLVAAVVLSMIGLFTAEHWAPAAGIGCALVGVAVRAWRDGMALGDEQERYQEMRHRLDLLTTRWETQKSDEERFLVAEEVEQMALEELRGFVRAHQRAQFLF